MKKTLNLLVFLFASLFLISSVSAVTTVSDCTTLSTNDTYVLNQSFTTTTGSPCLEFDSDDVVLDGNGYTISGGNQNAIDTAGFNNITIKNFIIRDFVGDAILVSSPSSNVTILNNTISHVGIAGIDAEAGGDTLLLTKLSIINNIINDTTNTAILLYGVQNLSITGNRVSKNGLTLEYIDSENGIISNNIFSGLSANSPTLLSIYNDNGLSNMELKNNTFMNNVYLKADIAMELSEVSDNRFVNEIYNTTSYVQLTGYSINSSYVNATFVNSNGYITIPSSITLNTTDTDNDISNAKLHIANNNIGIDSTFSYLNNSANIKFFGLSAFSDPILQRDGVDCTASICSLVVYSGVTNTLSATVTGFSNYTIIENTPIVPSPTANDPTDSDIYRTLQGTGAGLGLFIQYMTASVPTFILGLGLVLTIVAIVGYISLAIRQLLKSR